MGLLRSRILWKIYAVFVAVIVIAAVIVSVVVSGVIEERTLADVRRALGVRSQMLSRLSRPILESGRVAEGDEWIKTLGKETRTRFTVISAAGLVLSDSDKDPQLMDNHHLRPEVQDSVCHTFGVSTRYSATLKTRMICVSKISRLIPPSGAPVPSSRP